MNKINNLFNYKINASKRIALFQTHEKKNNFNFFKKKWKKYSKKTQSFFCLESSEISSSGIQAETWDFFQLARLAPEHTLCDVTIV